MRRLLYGTVLALAAVMVLGSVAMAQARPEFKMGFKALADKIPDVVGWPLENEEWGANGDSLQRTAKGLMVWRKADNWTAFTNGSMTWINGPYGVQSRANDQRFEWENDGSSAQQPVQRPTATPKPSTAEITLGQLKNGQFIVDDEKVKFSNGKATIPPYSSYFLQDDMVVFGDLNGDGVKDAAAIIVYNTGGSGTFYMLTGVVNRNGTPVQVANAGLGDRVQIKRFLISSDGEVQIRMITQGPDEPMCCPTMQVDWYYRLTPDGFKVSAQ